VATETDAARDRVLAARASLGEELETLEASARAAIDIPAKIKRSPGKAAAVVGGTAFLALGGPKRIFRAGKRAVTGEPEPLPPSMLPKEIDKALRSLGDDGKKVRGALERDFAAYAKQRAKDRSGLRTLIVLSVARPLLSGAAKAAAGRLFSPDEEGFQKRLAKIRQRSKGQPDGETETEAVAGAEDQPGETVMDRAKDVDAAKKADKDSGKNAGKAGT
jgi:hypothetical protein